MYISQNFPIDYAFMIWILYYLGQFNTNLFFKFCQKIWKMVHNWVESSTNPSGHMPNIHKT
jgi:hypothetical protein